MIDINSNPFPGLIGHEEIKERIYAILSSGNIPHAFLFSGKEGIGKFAFSLEILKYINQTKADNNSKEILERQIQLLHELYVHYVFPLPRGQNETATDNPYAFLSEDVMEEIQKEISKKSKNPYYDLKITSAQNIKISSIRRIKKQLAINTNDIPYRGIIIEHAERMSAEAQNSLLKSLEEPPDGVIFFILTKDENLLLPTIRSRCWIVNFGSLFNDEIVKILVKYFNADENVAQKIAPFSNGSVLGASKFLEEERYEIVEKTIDFLRKAISKKYNEALTFLNEIISDASNDIEFVVNLINLWLEDVLLVRHSELTNYSFVDFEDTFIKYNKSFPKAKVHQVIDSLQKIVMAYKQNVSLKIILMNIIFNVSSLGNR